MSLERLVVGHRRLAAQHGERAIPDLGRLVPELERAEIEVTEPDFLAERHRSRPYSYVTFATKNTK